MVVVSPDHGGTTRARKFALYFEAPIAIIDKRRPQPNVAEVMKILGDVDGKDVIIVDDIIDTAGTVTVAAKALKEAGARQIFVCCSHPVLSDPATIRIMASEIKEIVTTNSICLPLYKRTTKITQLSIAKILGQGILNIIDGKGVSDLFNYNPNQRF